jgi:S-adenosylmethionine-diacylglycerol 3-amino-3-carboxypropyl transferase
MAIREVLMNDHGSGLLRSEIARSMALDVIRYSQVWEDHQVLCDGLAITPQDDVLSIASSGCNVLALLLAGARTVTAIDMSPAQIALVELKIAGIRMLSHDTFVGFMGARPAVTPRLDTYQQIRHQLTPASLAFWDTHSANIEQGVIHCGRFDKYLRLFVEEHLPGVWPRGVKQRLLDAKSLAEQQRIYQSECDTQAFRALFRWFAGREMIASTGRDPAQLKYVLAGDLGEHFLQRFRHSMVNLATAGNYYLEYNLLGKYRDVETGPIYMRSTNFERLKGLVDRVQLVTDELEQYLGSRPVGCFSKANLSDVFEYMSTAASQRMFEVLARHLRDGGRLAYWNLLVPRTPSSSLRQRLKPLTETGERLHAVDRTWFYRSFHIDEVQAS